MVELGVAGGAVEVVPVVHLAAEPERLAVDHAAAEGINVAVNCQVFLLYAVTSLKIKLKLIFFI